MNPTASGGLTRPPTLAPLSARVAPARTAGAAPHRAADDADRVAPGRPVAESGSPPTPSVVDLPARMRVEVEWHAASLSYVHRILDPDTGRQISQLPAAQVLDMVDDLMSQIAKG